MSAEAQPAAIEIRREGHAEILSPQALEFLAGLTREFRPRLARLLQRRGQRGPLGFLESTRRIREGDWQCAAPPADLQKRHVEITGPVDRKMIINALNSGADVFMADFEDSSAPTWDNMLDGQRNLADAVRRTIAFEDPARGKSYSLDDDPATLIVRPRGLHLIEAGATLDGEPIPASIFDFGLYLFHNAKELLERGSGPYFYLPKLESHLEARWWNDLFVAAQQKLGIPRGSIRATVLIETLPAAFEMEEILHELREHSSGLNCGRWDYIFSFIKLHRDDPNALLPDRGQVTMEQPCMRAYTQLVVKSCHKRGIHAIGGMAAQVPIKNDPEANARAFDKVRKDKQREVRDGHDGTWVAHPGLVALAREAFAKVEGDHQIANKRDDVVADADALLQIPEGTRSEQGVRENVRVAVRYLAAWLDGRGCVPLYNLMEDAATAEISRAQLWHWLRHGAVERALVERVIAEECAEPELAEACELFKQLCFSEEMPEFLTTVAYDQLERTRHG